MGEIIPKLRASARGQQCTLRIPGVCNHDPATTVLCHLPTHKSAASKGDGWHAVFGCSACHDAIDGRFSASFQRRDRDVLDAMLDALRETQRIWFEMGLLRIAGDERDVKSKQSSKIVARKPSWRVS